MLEHSDLRTKIPILFMASSGMRLGGFVGLSDGCVRPIYEDDNNNSGKILAAHVKVYNGELEQYDTFISPEAWRVYNEYRSLRMKFGEQITVTSPILLRRFDVSPDGKRATIDNTKPVSLSTVAGLIKTVAFKAGVRQPSEYYKERYNVKIAHGFRKFFSSTLSNIKDNTGRNAIDFVKKEWLLGHSLTGVHSLEENYNRNDRVKTLLHDYLKAIPDLTISNEERLQVQVQTLQTDISNMKSVEMQLAERDKQVQNLHHQILTIQEAQKKAQEETQKQIEELLQYRSKTMGMLMRRI
jgi:hypothetical protein